MRKEKADSGRTMAIVLASLFVVVVNAYLIGVFKPGAFTLLANFDAYSLLVGLQAGLVLTLVGAQFVLRRQDEHGDETINDPVTGLYSRAYMQRIATRLIALQQRDPRAGFAMLLFEYSANDADVVTPLPERERRMQLSLAKLIRENIRETDYAVQFSAQQVAVFSACDNLATARISLQRLCAVINRSPVRIKAVEYPFRIKAAVVYHRSDESLQELLSRAEGELDVSKCQTELKVA